MSNSDFQEEFCLLQQCSIARERAVMKHIVDSRLKVNDFVIHLYGLEIHVTLLF